MTVQLSPAVRDAKLDAVETSIGASAQLKMWTGSPPANCATADSGSLLVTILCPVDWMAAASSGSKAKFGTWAVAASGTGTVGYFRLYDSTGATCGLQGTVTATGGGGDMTVDNTSVVAAQTVTVTGFTLTEGNQ